MTETSLPLFYQSPRVLTPQAHGNRSLRAANGHRFAASTNAVPLVAEEMPMAARHYPVVFSDEAQPHPVAILGLRGQANLFVDAAGAWRPGVYVPAYVRRYPFIFLENEPRTELTLCVDEAADSFVEGSENPLFDAQGQPTALTRNALVFCRDYQAQHRLGAELGRLLAQADLLIEHRADISFNNGQRLSLSGFKVIDEQRFAKLPDDTFLDWRRKGWLPLIYSHFYSIGAWSALIDRSVEG
ncbi:MAG: SapC family protein [Pseudomonadota bacterium]